MVKVVSRGGASQLATRARGVAAWSVGYPRMVGSHRSLQLIAASSSFLPRMSSSVSSDARTCRGIRPPDGWMDTSARGVAVVQRAARRARALSASKSLVRASSNLEARVRGVSPSPGADVAGVEPQSRCRCGTGEPQSRCRCGRGEPQSRRRCGGGEPQSRRRCGRGEPCPSADVAAVSPVPVQMWQG